MRVLFLRFPIRRWSNCACWRSGWMPFMWRGSAGREPGCLHIASGGRGRIVRSGCSWFGMGQCSGGRKPWRRVTQQAEDIFTLIEKDHLQWPEKVDEITKATFTVRLCREKRPRRVTIVPCNRALYSRDEESGMLERWMEARGLVRPVGGG